MNKEGYKCFKKKDFGQFVYIALGAALMAMGVLLLVQKEIGETSISLGLKITTLICGLGIIAGYFLNSRTRFRPCWTLPTGILFTFIGAGYLIQYGISSIKAPSATVSTVVILLTLINASLLLSSAIQVFSLRLRRWAYFGAYAVINFIFFIFVYTDAFGLKTNELTGCAIFMFIIALQLIIEGVIDLLKIANVNKRYASEEH